MYDQTWVTESKHRNSFFHLSLSSLKSPPKKNKTTENKTSTPQCKFYEEIICLLKFPNMVTAAINLPFCCLVRTFVDDGTVNCASISFTLLPVFCNVG